MTILKLGMASYSAPRMVVDTRQQLNEEASRPMKSSAWMRYPAHAGFSGLDPKRGVKWSWWPASWDDSFDFTAAGPPGGANSWAPVAT
uniref:Uncharacterized protein n=1 Tax=Setaria italica TaxID=4555 RepID=K3Z0R8_SETIT